MLRNVFLATTVVLVAGSANAADLAYGNFSAARAKPVFSWSGFYVGMNAGYGRSKQSLDSITVGGVTSTCSSFSNACAMGLRGTTVGGTVGLNVQTGPAVFGIEGDLNYSDFHAS